jgi:hypothetical protein
LRPAARATSIPSGTLASSRERSDDTNSEQHHS